MNPSGNLRGAMFMIASMAGFAVEDMFVKLAARQMPLGEILMIVGGVGAVCFVLLLGRSNDSIWNAAILSRPLVIRSSLEVMGRLFYALAITLTPLSVASAILQASPLVVVAGAATIFGERVGWRRWLAICAGFFGVLVILRPGLQGFDLLSILAVIGTLGFAGRDLATRAAPRSVSNLQLGAVGFGMLFVAGGLILAFTGGAALPDRGTAMLTLGATLFGMAGYFALIIAMRTGEISAVTPFRYTRLVFAMILGGAVFGERPDVSTMLGSAIIVASGIYALKRSPSR